MRISDWSSDVCSSDLRLALGHLRADAGDFALAQRGKKAAPVKDAAVPRSGGVALFDMMLAALVHGVAHLLTETGRSNIRCVGRNQSPVEPGRAIGDRKSTRLNSSH